MFFAGVQHKSTDVNYSLRICDVKNAYASEGSMNWALSAQTNTCSLKYHNIVNTSCPLSVQLHPPAIGRTRHQLHYLPIQASRDSFKLSFFICSIPTWNRPVSDSTISQGLSGHGPSSGERHASHPPSITSFKMMRMFLLAPCKILHLHDRTTRAPLIYHTLDKQ